MEKAKNTTKIAYNGLQIAFFPADVFSDFSARFLDEPACRQWVLRKLHPRGAFCPRCKSEVKATLLQRFWNNERIRCSRCGKYFTALSETFASGMHLSFSKVILLAILLAIDASIPTIAEKLCVDSETVRLWKRKFSGVK